MRSEVISQSEAQKLMFSHQLLNTNNKNTSQIIKHLGYIQIDTISVVERAHHHVLWSRNSNYKTDELNKLMKKRKVYEYWAHAASILPMSEYRYSLYKKNSSDPKKTTGFLETKK